jgi:hypothetical protein
MARVLALRALHVYERACASLGLGDVRISTFD